MNIFLFASQTQILSPHNIEKMYIIVYDYYYLSLYIIVIHLGIVMNFTITLIAVDQDDTRRTTWSHSWTTNQQGTKTVRCSLVMMVVMVLAKWWWCWRWLYWSSDSKLLQSTRYLQNQFPFLWKVFFHYS